MATYPVCATLAAVHVILLVCISGVASGLNEQHPYHEGNYGLSGLLRNDYDDTTTRWNYTNLNDWPKRCLTGSRQSPISFSNVDPEEVLTNVLLQRLQLSSECVFRREETQMRVVNEGLVKTVTFESQRHLPEDLSRCTVQDPLNTSRFYHFTGLAFHVTSEHHLRTLRPDAEMQVFFTTDDLSEKKNNLLAVSVMLKATSTFNTTSVRMLRHMLAEGSLPMPRSMTTCFLTEDISLASLFPHRQSYLLYDGSLTRPPCTENVRWVVMTSPIFISRVALGRLRDSMDELMPNEFSRFGNARPPQALNGRLIFRFDDNSVPAGQNKRQGYLGDAWNRKGTRPVNYSDGLKMWGVEKDLAAEMDSGDDGSRDHLVQPLGMDSPTTTTNASLQSSDVSSEDHTEDSPQQKKNSTHTHRRRWSVFPHGNQTSQGKDIMGNHSHANSINATTSPTATRETMDWVSDSYNVESSPATLANGTSASFKNVNGSSSASSNSTQSIGERTSYSPTTPSPMPTVKRPSDMPPSKTRHNSTAQKYESGFKSEVTGMWIGVKSRSVDALHAALAYAKTHPKRTGLVLVLFSVLIFLICTCCRTWKRPMYVVGIDPTELQPLHQDNHFERYGSTAAVRPSERTSGYKEKRGAAVF